MPDKAHRIAIIVAGGTGSRMQSTTPKQFLLLAGKPLLCHTLDRFFEALPGGEIILVLPGDQVPVWEALCQEYQYHKQVLVTAGGDTRYGSVKNGLARAGQQDAIIAVHDGVRPLITTALIRTLFEAAAEQGNAIPAVSLKDSIRLLTGEGSKAVDRGQYRAVQTPQCFKAPQLFEAYQLPFQAHFTDDASVVEAAGFPLHLVEGDPENLKITTPVDLKLAEAILEERR